MITYRFAYSIKTAIERKTSRIIRAIFTNNGFNLTLTVQWLCSYWIFSSKSKSIYTLQMLFFSALECFWYNWITNSLHVSPEKDIIDIEQIFKRFHGQPPFVREKNTEDYTCKNTSNKPNGYFRYSIAY